MCKVIGFTNFSKVRKKVDTVEYLGKLLLSTERDGFGYAIWDKNSKSFFGERTADRTFSSSFRDNPRIDFSFCDKPKKLQNSFGEFDFENVGPAIFHGRISTNSKNLNNTHPIVKHGTALVHNGVVTDHGPKYETITTNDSEHVLERFVDNTFEQNLTGYYAFLAINKEGELTVCRDTIAQLYSSWVEQLETYIFSTNEDNIVNTCKALGVDYSTIMKVSDNTMLTFQGNTITSKRVITSRGWSIVESRHSSKSLGYDLDSKWGGFGSGSTVYSRGYSQAHGNRVITKKTKKERKAEKKSQEVEHRPLTDDEKAYLDEVAMMDQSYVVISPKGKKVDIDRFKMYHLEAMKRFEVIRPDGTVVDWKDYQTDKLSYWNA